MAQIIERDPVIPQALGHLDEIKFGILTGLAGGNEKIIAESVRDIGTFDLTLIAPGHCTGWRAVNVLANAYGDSTVAPLAVGKIFAI